MELRCYMYFFTQLYMLSSLSYSLSICQLNDLPKVTEGKIQS